LGNVAHLKRKDTQMDTLMIAFSLLALDGRTAPKTVNVPAISASTFDASARESKLVKPDEVAYVDTRDMIAANVPEGCGATVSYMDHQ